MCSIISRKTLLTWPSMNTIPGLQKTLSSSMKWFKSIRTPNATVGAVQQQMGMAQAAPQIPQQAAPATGMFGGMPSMGQMPAQPAPQAPAFGQTPSFGAQPAVGDPRGFQEAAIPSGISDMIGGNPGMTQPSAPQPVAGLNLSDVLAGTMIDG